MKELLLSKGKTCIIDDEDFDYLNQWKWSAHISVKTCYARRKYKGRQILLHRELLNVIESPNVFVDHIDFNGLNNQRNNLRLCTRSQNNRNTKPRINSTSKYLGVCWHKGVKKWVAQIKADHKISHLGYFVDEKLAALAYDRRAIEIHGEFANLNFLV